MVDGIVVRLAAELDLVGLLDLKIEWAGRPAAADEREQLRFALDDWLQRPDVVCAVAEYRGELVGMAWMVDFDRVPDLGNVERHSADVQSVFVTPPHRGGGLGSELVRLLCAVADQRSIPRVIVHSSTRAMGLYHRAGFSASQKLMQREL